MSAIDEERRKLEDIVVSLDETRAAHLNNKGGE